MQNKQTYTQQCLMDFGHLISNLLLITIVRHTIIYGEKANIHRKHFLVNVRCVNNLHLFSFSIFGILCAYFASTISFCVFFFVLKLFVLSPHKSRTISYIYAF